MDLRQWSEQLVAWLSQLGLDPSVLGLGTEATGAVATAALLLLAGGLASGAAFLTQALTGGAKKKPAALEAPAQPTEAEPAEAPAEAEPAEAEPAAPAPTPARSDAEALRAGLSRTRQGFLAKLNGLLGRGSGLDAETTEELETLLVTADVGIRTTQGIIERLQSDLGADEKKDPTRVRAKLQALVEEVMGEAAEPWTFETTPRVVMVVGVNGVGKTTTIGKLAARYVGEGKKVVLAAADTFRAAAVEQLEIWGERSGATVIKGDDGADPSSVVFSAIETARHEGADLVLCDTAGRLQTKTNLMNELKKVHRVAGKAMDGAPHEVMIVLDATTGQNALSQVKKFKEAVAIDSIALTKLDGTAKGGVVVAIMSELSMPVRFAGVGEAVDDLRDFDPPAFVRGLFEGDVDAPAGAS